MRIAIISDIHANLEALTVCLNWIKENNIDKIICLGDLVDYCAQPNECIELIQKHCDKVILGNHDEAQFHLSIAEGFTTRAKVSSYHTRTIINPEYVEWFRTLKLTYSFENLLFVHASPLLPQMYNYVLEGWEARSNFKAFDEDVCFIGHSHVPVIFCESDGKTKKASVNKFIKGNRYIVNVGSVGQPRDYNPKLSFGLFDTDNFEYENVRLSYDIKSAAEKIIKEGLPVDLAERLFDGR